MVSILYSSQKVQGETFSLLNSVSFAVITAIDTYILYFLLNTALNFALIFGESYLVVFALACIIGFLQARACKDYKVIMEFVRNYIYCVSLYSTAFSTCILYFIV